MTLLIPGHFGGGHQACHDPAAEEEAAPFAMEFIAEHQEEGGTLTFNDEDIGTADDTRVVYVAVASQLSGAPGTPACTLDGNAMDLVVSSGDSFMAAIFKLAFPTGTTADIVFNFGVGTARTVYTVYSVTGDDTDVIDTDVDTAVDAGIQFSYDSAATYGVSGFGLIAAAICGFSGHLYDGGGWTACDTPSGSSGLGMQYAPGTLGFACFSNLGPLTSSGNAGIGKTGGTDGGLVFAVVGA